MMNSNEINTQRYWDGRFNEDWEQFDGPEQSRFFSNIALQNIPDWLLNKVKEKKLTVADWGCAQGDGTSIWAEHIASVQIAGIDFSEAAIQIAKKRYPNINFLAENWLDSDFKKDLKYDVVFSSNTLEHFHEPFDVLNKIATHAEKLIVLALPYKEHQRIDEHFFTFTPENIPNVIQKKFQLVWSRVINCQEIPASYWPGEQIILVFIESEWMESLDLKLSDISLGQDDLNSLTKMHDAVLAEGDQAINESNHVISERNQAISELNKAISDLNKAISERNQAIGERNQAMNEKARVDAVRGDLQTELQAIQASNSWAITRPLRFLGRLARYRLTKNDAHRLANIVKPYWRMLPIPHELRQSIAKRVRRFLAPAIPMASVKLKKSDTLQVLAAEEVDKPDYFIFSVIDWHFRHQRPQQLALQIEETGRRVFYISVDFVDHAEPGFAVESLDTSGRLFNLHLHLQGAPSVYGKPPTAEQMSQLSLSMGNLLEWTQSSSVVSLIQHSFWSELAARMPNSRLVYDCMDHHEGFGGVSDEMIAHERALLSAADLTVTTSLWLDNEVADKTSRHVLIRNATEFEHFAKIPVDIYKEPLGRRVIGYYGAIAEWFDVDLMAQVAQAFPECAVVLIGADTIGAQKKLEGCKNVSFLGEIPYKELPRYAHAFDVCLLPFKVIPLTLATNPVKAYEYLSMGKPVVSTGLPEVREMGTVCEVANDAGEFVSLVRKCLDQPGDGSERQAFAKAQTWAHRAKALIEVSEDHKHDPLASVIVVTYNNLELTKQCLASLDEYSDYPNMEVIVVDNASSDGSPEWLQQWGSVEGRNRKLILNADNRGFAAGNNLGLEIASGEYLVMLNNDTHVTPGWLRTMVNHMRRNPDLGLLGPVTNNIGNEARIDIFYDDMTQMMARSSQYTRSHVGQLYPLRTAAFFCVMLKRSVFEKIGPLDEAFGRGFFEDDDYCRRIEQAGLKVACAEDVFVHHHLSASFNKLKSQDRQKLFEDNKIIYESKWGAWFPHTHR